MPYDATAQPQHVQVGGKDPARLRERSAPVMRPARRRRCGALDISAAPGLAKFLTREQVDDILAPADLQERLLVRTLDEGTGPGEELRPATMAKMTGYRLSADASTTRAAEAGSTPLM